MDLGEMIHERRFILDIVLMIRTTTPSKLTKLSTESLSNPQITHCMLNTHTTPQVHTQDRQAGQVNRHSNTNLSLWHDDDDDISLWSVSQDDDMLILLNTNKGKENLKECLPDPDDDDDDDDEK